MLKPTRAVLFLMCLFAVACGGDDDDDGDDVDDGDDTQPIERRLVLFHTNDEHSHLFGFAPEIDDFPMPTEPGDGTIVGNIARRAEVLDDERALLEEDGIDSLTVSAGDQTQGALPQIAFASTSPDFSLMAQLGYDIMCPGNHEFDLGPEALAESIMAVGDDMPLMVSTNIRFSDEAGDDDLEGLYGEGGSDAPITPYQIIETAGGLRVGFIGIMGVSAAFYAPNKAPIEFSGDLTYEGDRAMILPALYDDLRPVVDLLRNDEEVDLVIALSHSGVDTGAPELGDDFNVAENVAGIDLIVSGHTHTALQTPVIAEGPDGYSVPIVQAGSYGRFLGRVELSVVTGERPELVAEGTRLIPIDDTIVASDNPIVGELDAIMADLEANDLPAQLGRIVGEDVFDDPKVIGDLYYMPLGMTTFNVIGQRSKVETNMLNLSTDAKLAAAAEFGPAEEPPTEIAVEASGNVRDDIIVGETGVMSYGDLYRVFPLGENPIDGSIGYPLSRFYIWTAELKAAFELGVSRGYIDDSLFLSASGVVVEYDTNRDAQVIMTVTDALDPDNGRVTKITVDLDPRDVIDETDPVIFDLSRKDPWDDGTGSTPFTLHSVVTTLYIASFADSAGVTLKDAGGGALELLETILLRPDGSDIKDYEAFIAYIRNISAKEGLPSRYDEKAVEGAIPRHMMCTGPLCL